MLVLSNYIISDIFSRVRDRGLTQHNNRIHSGPNLTNYLCHSKWLLIIIW